MQLNENAPESWECTLVINVITILTGQATRILLWENIFFDQLESINNNELWYTTLMSLKNDDASNN